MHDMYENKEDHIMHKLLFMREVGRVKADVSGVSWND